MAVACACAAAPWAAQPVALTPHAQANYMLYCMGCHLPDGSGAAGKVPSMRESLPVLSASSVGRAYLVQVPGAAESPLSDVELAQVLNWMVRNLSAPSAPSGFVEFSAAEVAGYRSGRLLDVGAARARLLAAAGKRGR